MENRYNIGISYLPYFRVLSIKLYTDDEIISLGKQLLGGRLNIGSEAGGSTRYNPHNLIKFNWDMEIGRTQNTFSLYLLGLRQIYFLSEAYRIEPNIHYLELADDFVKYFFKSLREDRIKNGMLYNEHAVAERTENLIHLYSTAEKAGYELNTKLEICENLEALLKFLMEEKNYLHNHNHGIIMDKAALASILFLNREDRDKSVDFIVERLKKQVYYAYYPDGAHKENSTDYGIYTTANLEGCLELLKIITHEFCEELSTYIDKSREFIRNTLKSDGSRPLFGDSKGKIEKSGSVSGTEKESVYIVANGEGEKGNGGAWSGELRAAKLSKRFPSGYIFMWEYYDRDKEKQSKATWLSFKAGYTTRVHKHRDDLSVCLYSKGYDIFVDSGMCGYMPRDKYKDYMESVPAHTTIGIKGREYSIASGNGEKFKIQKFQEYEEYDYAMASSRAYGNAVIYRHIYYLRKRDILIIRDELYSENDQEYVQYFNLSNHVEITEQRAGRAELCIGDTGYVAVIRQLSGGEELRVLRGEETEPMSIISTGFGTYAESKTLEYTKRGRNTEFVTLIEIKEKNAKDTAAEPYEGGISLRNGGIEIPMEKTVPVKYYGTETEVVENRIRIRNLGAGKDVRFAVYAYQNNEAEAYRKMPYTKEEWLEVEVPEQKDIVLLYYTANDTGEVIKGIIREYKSTESGLTECRKYDELHRPVVKGRSVKKVSGKKYEFHVDLDYDYPVSCSWWVYYNGSNQFFVQNNSLDFSYEFEKAGEYVVMYSFRDRFFGEFEFEQFEKIVV